MEYGVKKVQGKRFTEYIDDKDFINIRKDQTSDDLWIRYSTVKRGILNDSYNVVVFLETVGDYTLPLLSTIINKNVTYSYKNISGDTCVLLRSGSNLIEGEVSQEINNGDCYTFYLTDTEYKII